VRPKVIVGSSRRIYHAVQCEFDNDFQVTVWDQDVFRLTYSAPDSLLETLDSSDAGASSLRPDDLITRRGRIEPAVRDNVLLELRMFIGHLGRDRFASLVTCRVFPLLSTTLSEQSKRCDLRSGQHAPRSASEWAGRLAAGVHEYDDPATLTALAARRIG
jgi:hypothetical protein